MTCDCTGATGVVTKGLDTNLEAIPRKLSVLSLQRQLYLGHNKCYRFYYSLNIETLVVRDRLFFNRKSTMKERYLTKRHDDDDDDDDFMTVFFSDCCEPNLHVLFMLARNGKRPGLSLTHVFPLFQKSA